jgi:hypothetical protein
MRNLKQAAIAAGLVVAFYTMPSKLSAQIMYINNALTTETPISIDGLSPTGPATTGITSAQLSCDMVEYANYGSNSSEIKAIAWGNVNSMSPASWVGAGVRIEITGASPQVFIDNLPTAISVDVAIGEESNGVYDVALVYVDGNYPSQVIYLNVYTVIPGTGIFGPTTVPIRAGGLDPRIDIFTDNSSHSALSSGSVPLMKKYAITWWEINSSFARTTWAATGNLSSPSSSPTPQYICDGDDPDIAAQSEWDLANSSFKQFAYVLNRTAYPTPGYTLQVHQWDISGSSPTLQQTLETTTSVDFIDNYKIEAAATVSHAMPNIGYNAWYATASIHQSAPVYYPIQLRGYGYYCPTSGAPSLSTAILSDYNATGFGSVGSWCYAPSVAYMGTPYNLSSFTGIGDQAIVDYYSTYTNDVHGSGNRYGDFFADNISGLNAVSGYNEVNQNDLIAPVGLSLDGGQIAVATSSNTGYGQLAVWYDGDQIQTKESSTFQYKGTSVSNITSAPGYSTYPNPAINQLTVIGAKNASYTVIDMIGRIVASGIIDTKNVVIRTDHYAPGNYILNLSESGKSQSIQFVKQ